MIRLLSLLLGLSLLSGCTNFSGLREELQESRSQLGRLAGRVVSPACASCPTVLVAVGARDDERVHTYRVYERPGNFEMVTFGGSRYLFGFNDLNNDFEYQPGEPSGWVELPKIFKAGMRADGIELTLSQANTEAPGFGNLFDMRGMTLGAIDVELGAMASLDDPRFDQDVADLGMWQPLRFMKEGHAGIYFLQAFDPAKTPVLFVHGINGTPRHFSSIVVSLDKEKFQPWFLYYPSGIDLAALGDGMLGMISELHHRYPFKRMHLVAHSMGGLLTRSYLSACVKSKNCTYLRSFTSISSPFGGHDAAQSGVTYAPVVVPAWRNLAPGSPFLNSLFANKLPRNVPHHLVFGYRNTALVGKASGDGTITLASQLRREAQLQAVSLRGFDEDHMSILESEEAVAYINGLLLTAKSREQTE
ncbi:alpha/beta hydrolase [uncultured Dechloromonas sp.]|uniref:lipase family alpha/beta hydrolase n=1 Tax=uncultured Dechloromonas sp. TaxID=171719 RepID=UPI0025E195F1|nr:alpha/beta hydrolase [uncultured Dechloromonas sp.]